jgi:hypothetical protein
MVIIFAMLFYVYSKSSYMHIRLKNLYKILKKSHSAEPPQDKLNLKSLFKSHWKDQVNKVYRDLGGTFDPALINVETYDLYTERFSLILDSPVSFNRYRLITLRSQVYEKLPGFDMEKLKLYCRKYERECIKTGLAYPYWTNALAEEHFGKAELPGDLIKNGAPGWKFKVYQDFLQDAYAAFTGKRLLRLSVWDEFLYQGKITRLNEVLLSPDAPSEEALLKYIERRIFKLYQ